VTVGPVARRYVDALFELARKQGALEEVGAGVKRVAAELAVPAVESYLFDTRVPLGERRSKIERIAAELHPLVRNFVGLLFDKRREEVLRELEEAFHRRKLVEDGAAEGVVESAQPLGAGELSELSAALGRRLGKRVHLENRVVPDLIAGVRVTVDNRMIDYSAQGRLEGLRRKMAEAPLPSAAR